MKGARRARRIACSVHIVHLVAAFAAAPAQAGGDAVAGKAKAVMCAACHGRDGNSINPLWPKLAGQHAPYLVKQIKEFRSGGRKEPTMNAMSGALSDKDIEDLAAFYASQTPR